MDTNLTEAPTGAGVAFAGGFYAGRIRIGADVFALIVAPKAEGEHKTAPLLESSKSIPGALSFFDGAANTAALAEAGSDLAKWAQGLAIGGFTDWYLPARDELEVLYRSFKPTTEENYCWRGDNPSSVPPGYAYSLDVPAQSSAEAYREGAPEAFDDAWYWSSTQYAGGVAYAWYQYFGDGGQGDGHKDGPLRARAVRRVKV
jgi:hypothetical protein